MKASDVSVGFVTYNRHEDLKECLDSIKKQTKRPRKIIIVDSSSNDLTKKMARKFRGLNIFYHHSKRRLYQPAARNIILRKTKTKIIAFLDDDVVCNDKWLENIAKGYTYRNTVGVGGPAIDVDRKTLKPLMKIKQNPKNQNYFTSYGDIRGKSYRWIPANPVATQLMLGANMSFLTARLKEVGGFDEHYKFCAFREETDPQIPLIQKGHAFMYMPGALVLHKRFTKGGIRDNPKFSHHYVHGLYHKYMADKYFPKWKSRLSWIFWSQNPPSIPFCVILAIIRKDPDILRWHKGLWFGRS